MFSVSSLHFYIFFYSALTCTTSISHFPHFFLVVKFYQLLLSLISFQVLYLAFDYSRLLIIFDLICIFGTFIFIELCIQIMPSVDLLYKDIYNSYNLYLDYYYLFAISLCTLYIHVYLPYSGLLGQILLDFSQITFGLSNLIYLYHLPLHTILLSKLIYQIRSGTAYKLKPGLSVEYFLLSFLFKYFQSARSHFTLEA